MAEIEQSGLSYSEIARRSKQGGYPGISHARISQVVNGETPGADFCIGVARGLGIFAEEVLRRAGYLPLLPAEIVEEKEAMHLLRGMTPERRRISLDILRGLARKPHHELASQQERDIIRPPLPHGETDSLTLPDLESYPMTSEEWAGIKRQWIELHDSAPEAIRPYLVEMIRTVVVRHKKGPEEENFPEVPFAGEPTSEGGESKE